jgi:CheY-like chemotaxis protein
MSDKKRRRPREDSAAIGGSAPPLSDVAFFTSGSSPQPELHLPPPEPQMRWVPVVGIGASAGGLEAFTKFFRAMPDRSGIAFVLIMHLDPTHESMMAELLGKHTSMSVTQASDGMPIQPDHVYIIPPNKQLILEDSAIHLSKPVERRGLRMPIDRFFHSLAEDQGERAICVVLSGTGVYRRIDRSRSAERDFPHYDTYAKPPPLAPQPASVGPADLPPRQRRLPQIAQEVILDRLVPPTVLVDRQLQILYFHGATERYLIHPRGEPSNDLFSVAKRGIKTKLQQIARKALAEGQTMAVHAVVHDEEIARNVRLEAVPLKEPRELEGLVLITFEDEGRAEPKELDEAVGHFRDFAALELEDELKSTRQQLSVTIEELEAANEELKASNQEVMSMNEELQATNEELETVNTQLEAKVEMFGALRRVRADVRVFLMSGYSEQEISRRFIGQGLSGFVQKPFDLQTLRTAIGGALGLGQTRTVS